MLASPPKAVTDSKPPDPSAGPVAFLAGGGELGALMRAFDWHATPLGPPEGWPQSLKTAVRIMLPSRQPIWIGWGEELTYLYNDPYKSIIGGKHPRALGQPVAAVWREIWDDIAPMLSTAMSGDEGTYVEEQLLIMERNGYPEETYYTFSYSPIPEDGAGGGRAGGIICANTDDTRRVIGERQIALLRELAASTANARSWEEACERSARALATNPQDVLFAMIYVADPNGRIVSLAGSCGMPAGHPAAPASAALDNSLWPFEDVLGTHEPRLVGNLTTLFGSELPRGAWRQSSSQAVVLPIAATGKSGRPGALIVGLNPFRLYDDNYQGFLSLAAGQISASIGYARAYEEERKRAETLAELDRAKTAFFSNVSHEFRTPLTLMLGPIEEMLAKPSEERELLSLVHRNGLRLQRLVNMLLDFSRFEAGRVRASYEPVDLSLFTAELASTFRSACEKAGLELNVDCPLLPEPVYVDRDMWEKVVLNLVSNAFKFTLKGGIEVALRAVGRNAELTVRDTGAGIPPEEMPKLFERFHRVEGTPGRTQEGSGIGLALVQELARLHGGEVRAESELGRGTVFFVTVPFGKAHLPAEHIGAARPLESPQIGAAPFVEEALRWIPDAREDGGQPQPTAGKGTRPRILLADDNSDMRDYIRRLLSPEYDVTTVADGAAALQAVRRERPDLVLTDVMMPVLDGFGLLRELRADPETRGLPIIMLSARAGEESWVEGLDAGADDYLVKPFSARELEARVGAHLQMARLRRQTAEALQESHARFEALVNAAPIGIYFVDADLRIRQVNPLARPVFGDIEGLIGSDFVDVIHILWPQDYADEIVKRFRHTLATGEPYFASERVEERLDRKVLEYYEWQIHRISLPDGQYGVVCYFADVSRHVLAQQALADADRRKDEFLATLAHELRNPLAPIRNMLEIMKRSDGDADLMDKARAIMERQLSHMVRLIDDLLDVSRISRGKLELKRERVELASVLSQAVEACRPLAEPCPSGDRGQPARGTDLPGCRPGAAGAGLRKHPQQLLQVHRPGGKDLVHGRAPGRRGRGEDQGQRHRHPARQAGRHLRNLRAGRPDAGAVARRPRHRPDARAAARRDARRHGDGPQRRAGPGERIRGPSAHPGGAAEGWAGAGAGRPGFHDGPPHPGRRRQPGLGHEPRHVAGAERPRGPQRLRRPGGPGRGVRVPSRDRADGPRDAEAQRLRCGEPDPGTAVGQERDPFCPDRLGPGRGSPPHLRGRLRRPPRQAGRLRRDRKAARLGACYQPGAITNPVTQSSSGRWNGLA